MFVPFFVYAMQDDTLVVRGIHTYTLYLGYYTNGQFSDDMAYKESYVNFADYHYILRFDKCVKIST